MPFSVESVILASPRPRDDWEGPTRRTTSPHLRILEGLSSESKALRANLPHRRIREEG